VIIEMMVTLALADCSPKYSFEVFAPCMNLQDDLEPISFYNPHYSIEMLAWALAFTKAEKPCHNGSPWTVHFDLHSVE